MVIALYLSLEICVHWYSITRKVHCFLRLLEQAGTVSKSSDRLLDAAKLLQHSEVMLGRLRHWSLSHPEVPRMRVGLIHNFSLVQACGKRPIPLTKSLDK